MPPVTGGRIVSRRIGSVLLNQFAPKIRQFDHGQRLVRRPVLEQIARKYLGGGNAQSSSPSESTGQIINMVGSIFSSHGFRLAAVAALRSVGRKTRRALMGRKGEWRYSVSGRLDALPLDFSADQIVCRQCEGVRTLKAHSAKRPQWPRMKPPGHSFDWWLDDHKRFCSRPCSIVADTRCVCGPSFSSLS